MEVIKDYCEKRFHSQLSLNIENLRNSLIYHLFTAVDHSWLRSCIIPIWEIGTMNMTRDLRGSGNHTHWHAHRNTKRIGERRKASLCHSCKHGALRKWDCGYNKCNIRHFLRKCLSAGEYPTQPVFACDNYRRRIQKITHHVSSQIRNVVFLPR
jgi:hypothetical protein